MPHFGDLAQGAVRPARFVVEGNGRLERAKLERIVRQLTFDLGTPRVDLSAPVTLGVWRDEVVAAQATFEVDSGAPESREPGSDLAIGHGLILSSPRHRSRAGG